MKLLLIVFILVGAVILVGTTIRAVLKKKKKLEEQEKKQKKEYENSYPSWESYAEVSFDNWLDWFAINPDVWKFESVGYDTFDTNYHSVPYRGEIVSGAYWFRKADTSRATIVKFPYEDWAKFKGWYKEYKANKEAMEEQKIKAEEQAKNTKKTIELLNLIQKDIDSYKAMADEEIDSATKTCCEVAERIKKEA